MAELSGELVPIKDGYSGIDGCHCTADPRDRLFLCKLDRRDLEDRHLRILEEVSCLKKLANEQEDKIKRLATKLMRSGISSRLCIATVDVSEENDRINCLEAENSKLKGQVNLIKAQLSNHKLFTKSPVKARRNLHGSSSGPITCRSEGSRQPNRCDCNHRAAVDVNELSFRIQELEREREEMSNRIQELECEISTYETTNQRVKVAEHVEFIRLRRQIKQQQDECLENAKTNKALKEEVARLKGLVQETTSNNKRLSAQLMEEQEEKAQLEERISKTFNTENELRDRNEMIGDLLSEKDILSDHNRKLIDISSKFEKTEVENAELKRKLTNKHTEIQSLKEALSKEEANRLALQAANDRLLENIHELHKNIDLMTIKLMAESANQSTTTKRKSKSAKSSSEELKSSRSCKKCNGDVGKQRKKSTSPQFSCRGVQTSVDLTSKTMQTEKDVVVDDFKVTTTEPLLNKDDKNKAKVVVKANQPAQNGSSLSRVEMLKLLEQVQISTPLESVQSRRGDQVTRSNLETLLFGDV